MVLHCSYVLLELLIVLYSTERINNHVKELVCQPAGTRLTRYLRGGQTSHGSSPVGRSRTENWLLGSHQFGWHQQSAYGLHNTYIFLSVAAKVKGSTINDLHFT